MKILSIALYDLKRMFRDKGSLTMAIIVPIVFTFIFGLIFGNTGSSDKKVVLPVAIANYDKSSFTKELLDELKQDKSISFSIVDEEELYDNVKSASVEAGFIIPKDFSKKILKGDKSDIKVVKLPSSASFMVVETSIRTAFSKLSVKEGAQALFSDKLKDYSQTDRKRMLNEIGKQLDKSLSQPDILVVKESSYGSKNDSDEIDFSTSRSIIGVNIMFLMFTLILGCGGTILGERKIGTWDRLDISPTSKFEIMAGKIIGTFLQGWVQMGILILFGKYVMGVNWGNSLPATILVMNIYLLSGIGLGIFFSTIIRSNSQMTAISAVVIVSTSMLSGCYWPLEISPEFMQQIAKLFPQYWAMKGLNETVIASRGFEAVIEPLTVLLAMGAIFFILSVAAEAFKGFRKKSKTVSA
ncbi:MAG TPA: ABC transporter permease [Clostridia bacterium]|nr:ABC transporter permease [Clostridia bacterium]